MRTFGKKTGALIRKRRIELMMTQEVLTKTLGWKGRNCQQLSNCELGKNPLPVKHVNTISIALRLNRSLLLGAMIEDFRDCLEVEVNK